MAGEGDARVDLRAVLETHAVSIQYDRPQGFTQFHVCIGSERVADYISRLYKASTDP